MYMLIPTVHRHYRFHRNFMYFLRVHLLVHTKLPHIGPSPIHHHYVYPTLSAMYKVRR